MNHPVHPRLLLLFFPLCAFFLNSLTFFLSERTGKKILKNLKGERDQEKERLPTERLNDLKCENETTEGLLPR